MSGFAGILNLDGLPPDPLLMESMVGRLAARGCDGRQIQFVENVALCHVLLNTTDRALPENQPFSLDGWTWIVADARLDARDELIEQLKGAGHGTLDSGVDDAELIARAYDSWAEHAIARLRGDFSFALWDGRQRRLWCARDQLGVKPFFYAQFDRTIVVSNVLDCVRVHPAASGVLNELAIADFLMFGANQEPDTTTFRDVRRLPAAHTLMCTAERLECRRYWTLPIDEPLQYPNAFDYVDHFSELLRRAVRDRIRTSRVGVLMSGGLDSPALAAVANEHMRASSPNGAVVAFTSVYDRLLPDEERRYAGIVARRLNIPIHYDVRDDEPSIADWDRISVRTPEPVDNPAAVAAGAAFMKNAAAHARVFLYGEGPDTALKYEWQPMVRQLATRQPAALLRLGWDEVQRRPRLPLWMFAKHLLRKATEGRVWQETFPEWLDPDFVNRCGCRVRWEETRRPPRIAVAHPLRPQAYAALHSPLWGSLFESCDMHAAAGPAEIRFPFLDLELLRFMLAVPAVPWCREKLIIRVAMRDKLPREILNRKKTALAVSAELQRVPPAGLPRPPLAARLPAYVNPAKLPLAPKSALEMRVALRPLGLNYWLQGLDRNS